MVFLKRDIQGVFLGDGYSRGVFLDLRTCLLGPKGLGALLDLGLFLRVRNRKSTAQGSKTESGSSILINKSPRAQTSCPVDCVRRQSPEFHIAVLNNRSDATLNVDHAVSLTWTPGRLLT